MAVRTDDALGHGGLLEYCNYIQLFERRKEKAALPKADEADDQSADIHHFAK